MTKQHYITTAIIALLAGLCIGLSGCSSEQVGQQRQIAKLDETALKSLRNANKIIADTYKVEKASFIKEAKDENSIKVEVGDKNATEFKPEMRISRWEDEVSMKIGIPDKTKLVTEPKLGSDSVGELAINEEKIEYKEPDIEYHYYDIAPNEEHPEGAFEYEVVLKAKPLTNVVEMTIEIVSLNFFYQPELTQEEKDEGGGRPENVIGSYAVYHATKSNHKIGDKNYRAGKAFHIYRPKIVDSTGTEVWGILNIDEGNGLLTVEVPQDFLDKAVYPVVVDPTFGYTTKGGTARIENNNDMAGSKVETPSDCTSIDSITCWVKEASSRYGHTHAYGLYNDSSGDPSTFITSTNSWEFTQNYDNWKTLNFSSSQAVSASTNYWLLTYAEDFQAYYYDAVAGGVWNSPAGVYPDWEDLASGDKRDRRVSIYATYTVSAPPAPTGQSEFWFK